jgi:ethanolamine permease
LPLALAHIVGNNGVLYHLHITIGLFGLVVSFHGLILAGGRSSFEYGRERYAPAFLGKIHPAFQTPANALLVNMFFGVLALLTGKTSQIITLAVFGALTLYVISMISLLRLRIIEPDLPRPFVVPLYPVLPVTALAIALVALSAVSIYNPELAAIYFIILAVAFGIFKLFKPRSGKQ